MGKGSFSLCRKKSLRRLKKETQMTTQQPLPPAMLQNTALSSPNQAVTNLESSVDVSCAGVSIKAKKKTGGSRLWMRFDRFGQSELLTCDKSMIIKRAAIPARDLRILGPLFSHSSSILAREKAIVVNLEFIKAIVTAEEILLLDPLRQEVLPFVDQLRQQLPEKTTFTIQDAASAVERDNETPSLTEEQWLSVPEVVEVSQCNLPFEFQVLEIALEIVCIYLDSSVADLEIIAYPMLDDLARNVSTKNLEHVRSLKSNLTRLLARVQKVRDEIEHLLDDNEDMADLYLSRKWIQQSEAATLTRLPHPSSNSLITSNCLDDEDVEDLEMLLEAYFMQLDGTRNKILSVREYIDDTEDYVNIQLDNQRNELIQLQLTLTIASFAIGVETLIAGLFGMNIPCALYRMSGIFNVFVTGISAASVLLFLLILGYARWKKLIGS